MVNIANYSLFNGFGRYPLNLTVVIFALLSLYSFKVLNTKHYRSSF